MSRTLNKVQLIGRLGGDPQMRYTASGVPVTTFSIATNRQWQDKDGMLHEEADWHNIVAWDKLAQTCADYLTKGLLVYVEGRLQYRSWEYEGQMRYRTEIVATNMMMLDPKSTAVNNGTNGLQSIEEPEPVMEMETRSQRTTPSRAPVAASVVAEKPGRPSRAAVLEAEEDPDDLPF
jgi:single-strand DNA-binding protein